MISFLASSDNMAFTIALGLMLLIGLLEVVSLFIGADLSEVLNDILPDLSDAEVDVDSAFSLESIDASTHSLSTIAHALTWLGLGKVPMLILLVIFLCFFGVTGLVIQFFVQKVAGGHLLPVWLAWVPTMAITLPLMRWTARGFARVLPKEETSAVSSQTFIGRVAVVVVGTARLGSPAQAKLSDQHNQTHYLMVEPDDGNEEFPTGTNVILVKNNGAVFQAIRNPSDALVD